MVRLQIVTSEPDPFLHVDQHGRVLLHCPARAKEGTGAVRLAPGATLSWIGMDSRGRGAPSYGSARRLGGAPGREA